MTKPRTIHQLLIESYAPARARCLCQGFELWHTEKLPRDAIMEHFRRHIALHEGEKVKPQALYVGERYKPKPWKEPDAKPYS